MQWVLEHIEKTGVTQKAIADALGLTESQVSKALKGDRRFTANEADELRRFFGYSLPDDLPADPIEASLLDAVRRLDKDQRKLAEKLLGTLREGS